MVVLNINGLAYNYPELDDEDWGDIATVAMQAMASLTATLRNPTLPAATIGQLRLGNTNSIAWRTFANDANIRLYVDTDDVLYYQKASDTPINLIAAASGNVTGPLSATDNAVVRFDQTTGQLIQNSVAILTDAGALSGLTTLQTSSNAIIGGNITVTGGIINPASAQILHLAKADGSVQIGDTAVDGVLDLLGTASALSFGTGQKWLLDLESNDLVMSGGTSGDPAMTFTYASKLLDLHGYAVSNIGATFLPAVDAATPMGSTSKTFQSLFLDNGATDGGAVYFNAGTSQFVKCNAAGTILTLGGLSQVAPSVNTTDLGTTAIPFATLNLAFNRGTSTPDVNQLTADLIPKAWFRSDGTGSNSVTGVNLIMSSRSATGKYDYTFRTNLANANYAVMVSPSDAIGDFQATVSVQTSSGFRVNMSSGAGTATNVAHSIVVFGTQ